MSEQRAQQQVGNTTGDGQAGQRSRSAPMSRFRMIVVCLALLLEGMSSSSINVQVGAFATELRIGGAELGLVASAFLLSYAGLLPMAGRLVDSWNRRTVFLFGITLFGVGCLVCAGASEAWMLVAGRFVQGAGAALGAPAALALITVGLIEGAARSRAIALYGAMGAAGFSLGLVLPGAVVAFLGWRMSFVVFVPIVMLVLAVTWTVRNAQARERQRIDLVGAALLTATLILAMHALGGITTLGIPVLVGHVVAACVLVGILIARRGVAGFPAEVIRSARVIAACIGLASVFAGVVASMFVLSLGLTARTDAFMIGLLILPQPLAFSLLSGIGARLVTQIGPARTFAAGAAVLIVSIGYLGVVGLSAPPWLGVLPSMAGVGVSLALCFPAASIAAVNAVPETFRGTTAGVLTASQNIGGALGLAVVAAIGAVPTVENESTIGVGMFVSVAVVAVGVIAAAARVITGRRQVVA